MLYFTILAQTILIALKLYHVITWGWILILIPIWSVLICMAIPLICIVIPTILASIGILALAIIEKIEKIKGK
jgi:hypothetical protein